MIDSINPATEEVLLSFALHTRDEIEAALCEAHTAFLEWRRAPVAMRSNLMRKAATYLRQHSSRFAGMITAEMGKPITEAEAEIEKSAWNCDYYAENGESFLREEPRASSASESYVQFISLGTILAVMPWNFPFWQVFRFAAPALMAGNTAVLKHASNVPQCALAIEEVFRKTGFPDGAFRTLLTTSATVESLIEDARIAAITLTGSEGAGSQVASHAGRVFKKTVMELGGSDPFIVLEDANLDLAIPTAIKARFQNTGQSCIAAKRFIVVESIFAEFERRCAQGVKELKIGDPSDRSTEVGPLARPDLLDELERQVHESVAQGAKLLLGGKRRPGRGYFFEPTLLSEVRPDMTAFREEVFGPVMPLMRVAGTNEAIRIANDTPYGLGASLWTSNLDQARRLAREIESGQVFINGMVASDPRLPFGGVKHSGYGRELSDFGIREFVNIQTVWIGPRCAS